MIVLGLISLKKSDLRTTIGKRMNKIFWDLFLISICFILFIGIYYFLYYGIGLTLLGFKTAYIIIEVGWSLDAAVYTYYTLK